MVKTAIIFISNCLKRVYTVVVCKILRQLEQVDYLEQLGTTISLFLEQLRSTRISHKGEQLDYVRTPGNTYEVDYLRTTRNNQIL